MIALCATLVGGVLAGCEEASEAAPNRPNPPATSADGASSPSADGGEDVISGTVKIAIDGKTVNVSCAGEPAADRPVVILLPGLGDSIKDMAGIQETLSARNRVCAYDRLGEGESDQPDGQQTFESTGEILTKLVERVAGGAPVVLAGHSLGGMIAARYAPGHQDTVAGLVLIDATTPTTVADTTNIIPETATGEAGTLRAGTIAAYGGENQEQLVITDGEVESAGDIPVEVIQHGQQYLAALPEFGPGLERAWGEGQRKWLAVSTNSTLSTAANSAHHIYRDEPQVVVEAIERVVSEAAK
ncbi:alpha/beta fold hydrolase [Actinophytocola sediminis]